MPNQILRSAKLLLIATLVYNIAEGVIALWAGFRAGSLALVAFGVDSYLEVAAAAVVLWRLGIADKERGEQAERTAMRFIGWTFLVLAVGVVLQSVVSLAGGEGAEESVAGIGLALASVIVMPTIALWKLRLAARGQSAALAAEAKETLACAWLSITLLAGLIANALAGWWWLDAAAALLLVPRLVKEGLEGIRGEEEAEEAVRVCSCSSCLFGLRACPLECCATS